MNAEDKTISKRQAMTIASIIRTSVEQAGSFKRAIEELKNIARHYGFFMTTEEISEVKKMVDRLEEIRRSSNDSGEKQISFMIDSKN